MSSIIDTGSATCVIFGDSAGAVVVSAAEQPADSGLRRIDGAAATLHARGRQSAAGIAQTVDQRLHYVKQDGRAVFKFAVRKTERSRAGCSIATA